MSHLLSTDTFQLYLDEEGASCTLEDAYDFFELHRHITQNLEVVTIELAWSQKPQRRQPLATLWRNCDYTAPTSPWQGSWFVNPSNGSDPLSWVWKPLTSGMEELLTYLPQMRPILQRGEPYAILAKRAS